MSMLKTLRRRCATERGASLVEYALLVALIAVVCITAVTYVGTSAGGTLDKAGNGMAGAGASSSQQQACADGGGTWVGPHDDIDVSHCHY